MSQTRHENKSQMPKNSKTELWYHRFHASQPAQLPSALYGRPMIQNSDPRKKDATTCMNIARLPSVKSSPPSDPPMLLVLMCGMFVVFASHEEKS